MLMAALAPLLLASAAPSSGTIRYEGGATAYLPPGHGDGPRPLLLLLHGTGGSGRAMIDALRPLADRHGVALLAVNSADENWDAVDRFFDEYERGSAEGRTRWPTPRFGADARRIEAAMRAIFATATIDRSRVGVLGFSHGASYALSLGAAHPELFGTIIALSPGILALPRETCGRQRIYVSHGTRDRVLSYRRTRTSFLPRLTGLGYGVTFRPFEGGHVFADAVAEEAVRLFVSGTLHRNPRPAACRIHGLRRARPSAVSS